MSTANPRRMRFDIPDAAPSERLNRILWHDARGWRTPYPAVKQSLFFPMSISIASGGLARAQAAAALRFPGVASLRRPTILSLVASSAS